MQHEDMARASLEYLIALEQAERDHIEQATEARKEALKTRPANEVPTVTSCLPQIGFLKEMFTELHRARSEQTALKHQLAEADRAVKQARLDVDRYEAGLAQAQASIAEAATTVRALSSRAPRPVESVFHQGVPSGEVVKGQIGA